MSHDDIRAALEAATPRPWHAWDRGIGYEVHVGPDCEVTPDARCSELNGEFRETFTGADAHLIAHAPEWLAELLAEVDNARRELGDVHVSLYSEIAMLTARAEAAEQTIQRVRAIHYAADNDLARTPVCSNCEGRAGVHDCGCWADEDRQPVCGHCNEGWKGASVPWPCATVRALDGGEQHG